MTSEILKIVEYLNVSLKKTDFKARLQFGRKTTVTNDGIYFFHKDSLPINAVSKEDLSKIIQSHLSKLDPGVVTVIEEFLEVNTSLLNRDACYIPLQKCDEVAQFLGVK